MASNNFALHAYAVFDLGWVFLLTTFATLQQNHYSYKCLSSSLEASMIECEDLSTQPNEGGGGGKIVEYLDRHDVQCPENKVHAWKYASDHDLSLTI